MAEESESGLETVELTFEDFNLSIQCHSSFRSTLLDSKHNIDLTGVMIWPGSRVLAHFFALHVEAFSNRRMIELGSGVGVGGLMAAKVASYCTLTDREQMALDLLQQNIVSNALESKACAKVLEWGHDLDTSLKACPPFDLIIGADIVYPDTPCHLLFDTILFMITNFITAPPSDDSFLSGAQFLVSYVQRTRDTSKRLFDAAVSHGFQCRRLDVDPKIPNPMQAYILVFTYVGEAVDGSWVDQPFFKSLVEPPPKKQEECESSDDEGWINGIDLDEDDFQ
eukprot:GILI01029182.1.p1 GENE.GILI01029182.1~~GILI01029182.1.p1  ORF type:complete len:281 (+),score=13.58 GILI01029182.1:38-880(+)